MNAVYAFKTKIKRKKKWMFGKEKLLVIAFLIVIVGLNRCAVKDNNISRMKLFDLNWKFSLGNDSLATEIDFDNDKWRSIDLPHNWNNDDDLKTFLNNDSETRLKAFGWYQKQFDIPHDWQGKSIQIDFEGICDQSAVFLNGNLIKNTNIRDHSFQASLNPYLKEQGSNVIAVRVPAPWQSSAGAQAASGIYKHVWLVIQESPDFTMNN